MAEKLAGKFAWIAELLKLRPRVAKHKLKWPVPEMRLVAPVEDAEKTVAALKKAKATFLRGGEFKDEVYAKEFAEGVYAYFVIRVDKRTEEERVLFEGYMLEERERLGMEVESRYVIARDLEAMGYSRIFPRDIIVWNFNYAGLPATVSSIAGFGDFVEVALPATKFAEHRERDEKLMRKLFTALGVEGEVLPTDVITLQYVVIREGVEREEAEREARKAEENNSKAEEKSRAEGVRPRKGFAPGEFKLGKSE